MTRPANVGPGRVIGSGSTGTIGPPTVQVGLGGLIDVNLDGLADGDVIHWDATEGTWVVGPGSEAGPVVPFDHGTMGATETLDLADGVWHRGTLDMACTITVQGFTVDEAAEMVVELTGDFAITWDTDVDAGGGDDQPNASGATTFVLWTSVGDGTIYLSKAGGSSSGSVATDTIFDAKGDLAVGTGADTAAKLTAGANDTILMADSSQTTGLKWVGSQTPSTQAYSDSAAEGTADTYARGDHKHGMPASGGGSTAYGQTPIYPTSFSGNDDPMTATTNWVDTSAFDTKAIEDGTLHLKTLGASKDQRVRYTLGTTRAGAFDLVFGSVLHGGMYWGTDADAYFEIAGSTSGGTVLFLARILNRSSANGLGNQIVRVGGTSVVTSNGEPNFTHLPTTLRVVRDGSNNVTFFYSHGTAPVALAPVLKAADNVPYSVSSSGTLARIELSIHTPSGPGSTAQWDAWLDYFKDNS